MTEFPYDTYVDKAVARGDLSRYVEYRWYGESVTYFTLPERELRSMLADAWLSGLGHSLELIETKRRSNDVEPTEASVGRPAL